jgi:hypothetical protein
MRTYADACVCVCVCVTSNCVERDRCQHEEGPGAPVPNLLLTLPNLLLTGASTKRAQALLLVGVC